MTSEIENAQTIMLIDTVLTAVTYKRWRDISALFISGYGIMGLLLLKHFQNYIWDPEWHENRVFLALIIYTPKSSSNQLRFQV